MQRNSRKEGPDVWQFRWSATRLDGKRLYHKKIVGTVEQYPDEDAARRSVVGLVSELNTDGRPPNSGTMTVAQLCDHFEQRELAKENTWRSHATKKIYKAYLTRWIRPHWQKYGLAEVRTIQVESWLRGLPLAKSSCAKIRNLMSVLFNHACRCELFDRNPIYLVRQSAKRRTPPATLVPAEIKALIDGLALRERTLVLLAASTGLRQSEIFGLKWGDIDFERGTMSVIRSIVYGVVGPCKTESSQKPVPMHPTLADAVEKTLYLHQAGGLGFCKQALSRPKTVLGPGDLAQIHTSCSSTSRNSEAIRMAYVPSHLLDPAAKRGD
jgi:integrase